MSDETKPSPEIEMRLTKECKRLLKYEPVEPKESAISGPVYVRKTLFGESFPQRIIVDVRSA